MDYIAHVKADGDAGAKGARWRAPHLLEDHLIKVAGLTEKFAKDIGPEWGHLAGLWHDLGKYRQRFQDYIRSKSGYERENASIENGSRAPHSTAGAIYAIRELDSRVGYILAYIIAGHHAGLPDWEGGKGALSYRIDNGQAELDEALAENVPAVILKGFTLQLPLIAHKAESISLWIRMMFSCLVDADFLDTESYMQPDQVAFRQPPLKLADLHSRFEKSLSAMVRKAEPSPLNQLRNEIRQACLSAAHLKPGLFSLTVPTGGGKTLSSLAFALKHAKIHHKSRIIYAIPFTSIIEQNAQVFRDILGDDAVLEHHSNLDQAPEKESLRSRLATENWHHPLVVTTNVQLFESLHASRTSRCRKCHNLINSVIILDEAQQIPRDFHAPIIQVMQQMSDYLGVTWVLCTATQPVLTKASNNFGQVLFKGLDKVHEIILNPAQLAQQLKRVQVNLPTDPSKISWQDLAQELMLEACVLVIVNIRRHAKTLYQELLDDGNNLHLSASMCAEHRTKVINEIKHRLQLRKEGNTRPLRVVSTQLVEAGVDLDFPVVYRAMAGLDSIAQAAGRCNREGKLEMGQVHVFQPEEGAPKGFLQQGESITKELLVCGELSDPLAPSSFERYFALLNERGDRDKHNIVEKLKASSSPDAPLAIAFRSAAEKFRLIDECGEALVVPYRPDLASEESPVEQWIAVLEKDPSQKWANRKLQRYTVTVPEMMAKALDLAGHLIARGGRAVLSEAAYDACWGVVVPEDMLSAENSVI